jgi:arylsulfatase A-like enzyme
MPLRFLVAIVTLLFLAEHSFASEKSGKAKHVVVIVWDGMRPDFISESNTPTLWKFAHEGVIFRNHHSVYPTMTDVNGVVLATGDEPAHSGVIANEEYRAEIDRINHLIPRIFRRSIRSTKFTSNFSRPTVAEIVQKAGYRTAIAGAKPVVQLTIVPASARSLMLRANQSSSIEGRSSTANVRPRSLPRWSVTNPDRFPNDKEDAWTTRGPDRVSLEKGRAEIFPSLVERAGPFRTSNRARFAHRAGRPDQKQRRQPRKILATLKAKNALTNTDLIIVSDHGFSTVDRAIDAGGTLRGRFRRGSGFCRQTASRQILVVTLGGSVGFYVADHDQKVIDRLVEFLQRSDFAGVIPHADAREGTFTWSKRR